MSALDLDAIDREYEEAGIRPPEGAYMTPEQIAAIEANNAMLSRAAVLAAEETRSEKHRADAAEAEVARLQGLLT